jgi:hypothetical protein
MLAGAVLMGQMMPPARCACKRPRMRAGLIRNKNAVADASKLKSGRPDDGRRSGTRSMPAAKARL